VADGSEGKLQALVDDNAQRTTTSQNLQLTRVKAFLTSYTPPHRQNLREADDSDRKLQALVDDNAQQFAALGLGTLPGRSGGRQKV